MILKQHIIFIVVLVFPLLTIAQNDEKLIQEIEVIKAYTPTISDAFKINELPVIKDSAKIEPMFQYGIESKQIPVEFQVEPIKSAKMMDEPLSKLYNSYIKLGFGNYITPYAELFINNLRSKKYNYSAILKHQSSHGTIKNDAGKQTYAGYVDNSISISGKRFLTKKVVFGTANYKDNSVNFYGYNTADTSIKTPPVNKADIVTQQFTLASFNGGIKTLYTDKSHLNYNIWMNYHYFQDKFKKSENYTSFHGRLNKYYNKELIGADVDMYFNHKSFNDTASSIIRLNPWVSRVTEKWEVRIGLVGSVDVYWKEKFHFYPDIYLQYSVVGNYLVPFFGLNGFVEENSYRKVASENMFITPGLDLKTTNHSKVIYGGFKGSVSQNTYYNIKATFSELKNTYFFVNDTTLNQSSIRLQDKFVATPTNANLLHMEGDLAVKISDKLNMKLQGSYSYFNNMEKNMYAWHVPEFELGTSAGYNLKNKFIITADVFVIGKRKARMFDFDSIADNKHPVIVKTLKPFVDGNLGFEYRYNKALSGFLNINNIANQVYYRWNNYRMQGFNIMAGITYSF